jgi:hypothetical protein
VGGNNTGEPIVDLTVREPNTFAFAFGRSSPNALYVRAVTCAGP